MAFLLFLVPILLTAISQAENSTDFILRNCAATLYPRRCYASLKPYATAVHRNPLALAVAAANVSLAKIKTASLQAAACRRSGSGSGSVSAALRDCVDSLRVAADLTRQSAAAMQKLVPADGAGFGFEVSNAQTWMSAALTNEDTCIDGFEGDGGGRGGAAVKGFVESVGRLKEYASNALALLNALVVG